MALDHTRTAGSKPAMSAVNPELAFAVTSLERWFQGRALVRTENEAGARVFRGCDLGLFRALTGSLVRVSVRAESLIAEFEGGLALWVRLGPSGKFLKRAPDELVKWSRARFVLDSGEVIHFQDQALQGHLDVRAAAKATVQTVTVDRLQAALVGSTQALSVALTDPTRRLGFGLAQVVEALFRAGVHPERVPATLAATEWKALTTGLSETRDAFDASLTLGARCPSCAGALDARTHGGERVLACPVCQPRGRSRLGEAKPREHRRPRRYRG